MVLTLDDVRNDSQWEFLMCKLSKCHFKIEFRQTVMELGWEGGQPCCAPTASEANLPSHGHNDDREQKPPVVVTFVREHGHQ